MQAKHFRSLLLMLLLNLLIKPFWIFGIDRNVQIAVGTDAYGLYYSLFNLSFIFQIILDPGVHTFLNKNIAKDEAQLSHYLSSFIPLKLGLSIFYLLISFAGCMLLGYNAEAMHLFLMLALSQILASLILYFRAHLQGLHLFNTDSLFSVLDRTLMIILCGALLWGNITEGKFSISWYIYAQTTSYLIVAAVCFFTVLGKTKFFAPRIDFNTMKGTLKESYPYAILAILMTIYTRIDAIMIERLLPGNTGVEQAGVYASAYRLLDALNNLAFLFATILLPVFSGMIQRKEDAGKTAAATFPILMVPAFITCLASYFFREEIMTLLYGNHVEGNAPLFGWLMFTFLAISMIYIYGTLLTANGNIRFLIVSSAAGVAANVIFNFILIPRYNAMGAVIATLITQMMVSGSQVLKAYKVFSIKTTSVEWGKSVAFIIFSVVSFAFLHGIFSVWWFNLLFLFILNITFALLIRLLSLQYFIHLIKTKT